MKRWPRGAATQGARVLPIAALYDDPDSRVPAAWPELLAQWQNLQHALPELLDAALRKLLGEELALRPEHIRETVRELLERMQPSGDTLTLRVNPEDTPLLASLALTGVRVVADESIARGGCILAHAHAELDARLETRLQRVLLALRD